MLLLLAALRLVCAAGQSGSGARVRPHAVPSEAEKNL
jgi:hypothetical protein